jgi:GWxTD domain-containing protein
MGVLIESALRAALLALAAAVVLRAMRVKTAAGRHAVWTIVLVGMLALPLWTLWGPKASVPVSVPAGVRAMSSPPSPVMSPPGPVGTSERSTSSRVEQRLLAGSVARMRATLPATQTWRTIVIAIYGVGLFVLLGRLIIGTVRAQRLIRQAGDRLGHLTSDRCSAPFTVGWVRPVVILPANWQSWPAAQLEAVLLHEQEHARRRDPLIQWIALTNRAVFWFHPLAWWLERHLARLAEEACDAAVLARGHQPGDYCEYLLDLARSVTGAGARVNVVGAAMPGAFLSHRIRRILKAVPESPTTTRRLTWAIVACAATSVVVMASTLAPAAPAAQGERLSDHWFDDDEWHLEATPLMTRAERTAYAELQTVPAREAFIADFWTRHDPTPGTAANEFRREFERRIRYAKERFANPDSAATFGYQSDRGRWYVMAGHPDAIRVFGSRDADANGVSPRIEEWDYQLLDDLGSNVTVRFDLSSNFACTYRGGKYRIVSPSPIARFDGVTSGGSGRRPFAQTYPGHFVYLSFAIDPQAVALRWGMRTGGDGQIVLGEETGPIDYVQGEIGAMADAGRPASREPSKPVTPILAHLAGLSFFEPGGIACTEQLPPDTYTLRIDSRLMNGETRVDSLTFTVE